MFSSSTKDMAWRVFPTSDDHKQRGTHLSFFPPRRIPVRRAAMRPTFLPAGDCLLTVAGWPTCWWFLPPCGCSTGFMALPRKPRIFGAPWASRAMKPRISSPETQAFVRKRPSGPSPGGSSHRVCMDRSVFNLPVFLWSELWPNTYFFIEN